ncbi:MAG: AAA domain-containing protein, partial [Desulfamplus sp.]
MLKYSNIISFFTNCVEAENSESFTIPQNKNNIFYLSSSYIEDIYKLLNGYEAYFEINGEPNLSQFIAYKNNYKKSDKIFLSLELITKKEKLTSFFPLYVIEVLVEELQKSETDSDKTFSSIRISTIDIQPVFNYSLLDSTVTIHDRFLLMDEISDESNWENKRRLYFNNIDAKLSQSIKIQPVLFLSSDLHSIQAATAPELDWINKHFIQKIPETALVTIFDRIKKTPPQYKEQKYLEIFPLNKVQREVVRFALNNPFTVITGPPGTGKSQIVLNLLANIYINGKTVLFASKNNKAVNTVIEKMESIKSGFCPFIRLGNKKEKDIGLRKILTNIDDTYEIELPSIYFDEIRTLPNEIDELYEKFKESEELFNLYCSNIKTLSIKSKELPSHLQAILYDGILNKVNEYEITFLKLIKDLKSCDKNLSEAQNQLRNLENSFNEKQIELSIFKEDLGYLEVDSEGYFKLPLIKSESKDELLKFIEKIEQQDAANKTIELKINKKEALLKNLQLRVANLWSSFESFIATNFDSELKSLIENNLDHASKNVDSNFSSLIQLKTDIQLFISELKQKVSFFENESKSQKVNSITKNLILLLFRLESASLPPLINEKDKEEFLEFIDKIEEQQNFNKNIQAQINNKEIDIKRLNIKLQELNLSFENFIKNSKFDTELKYLLEENLDILEKSIRFNFPALNQLKESIKQYIFDLREDCSFFKNELEIQKVNSITKNLILLLFRLESASLPPLINEKDKEEFLEFIDRIEEQQNFNENIQAQIDKKEPIVKELELELQDLESNFEIFVENNFEPELKSLIEEHSDIVSKDIDKFNFAALNQLKESIKQYIADLREDCSFFKNELETQKVNSITKNLILLLFRVESASLPLLINEKDKEEFLEFIDKIEEQQNFNKNIQAQIDNKEIDIKRLNIKLQELNLSFENFIKNSKFDTELKYLLEENL